MARKSTKKSRPSDQPTKAEEAKLPAARMDAETIQHFNTKLDREISAKNTAGGAEGQIWQSFEKAGGNKAALKMARKLVNQDAIKAQGFIIAFRDYCLAIGVFNQTDMFEKLFLGEQTAPAPTDPAELLKVNQAGVNAGMNGKDQQSNPYPEGTEAHAKWDAGWLGGQKQLAAKMGNNARDEKIVAAGREAAQRRARPSRRTRMRRAAMPTCCGARAGPRYQSRRWRQRRTLRRLPLCTDAV